ncbi:transcriptional regulator [Ferroacidibacillus organovorans]|uniref:Transcriptional regulator n=1 Tax=Ferroacidibacillus organovorans TaxID=1765683 RepID=A0A1V4EXB0_9BACL|nr:transcriptional regulator [Ferroacidibacillus organovorans]
MAIVRENGPITGEKIAELLNFTRATLRPDLTVLTLSGILDARPRVGYFYVGNQTASVFGELLRKSLVRDYKSVPIVVHEQTTAYDATVTMFLEDVGTLFVVRDGGILCGVLSRKDLLKLAIGQTTLKEVPISIAMTRMPNIYTVKPETSIYDAGKLLIHAQIDSLPVVIPSEVASGQWEVVGRVTKTTITRLFVELGESKQV